MRRAFSGLRAWLVQRFTAVWMLFFLVFVLLHFALHPPGSFDEWQAWVGAPFVRLAAALFFLSLFVHAWVGLRDVLIDYARALPLRLALLAALCLVLAGLALWVLQVLLRAGAASPWECQQ
jgi:succinate dehydrogenase / fumarate reductase membrane anchor subunit